VQVLLDVDTGVDDALALLLALRSPHLDLSAVTCVAGNVALDQVVHNTLTVLDVAGASGVPVACGVDGGVGPRAVPEYGVDGLGDLGLPTPSCGAVSEPAVDLLYRVIKAADEPPVIVAAGPLSNIAALL
jgi:pyrimidine-specific ribonucleoside hydrolase